MDYKEFYKNELFPENEVFITDALLEKNNWDDKVAIDEDCQSYYFYQGPGFQFLGVFKEHDRPMLRKIEHAKDFGVPSCT